MTISTARQTYFDELENLLQYTEENPSLNAEIRQVLDPGTFNEARELITRAEAILDTPPAPQ